MLHSDLAELKKDKSKGPIDGHGFPNRWNLTELY